MTDLERIVIMDKRGDVHRELLVEPHRVEAIYAAWEDFRSGRMAVERFREVVGLPPVEDGETA